MRTLLILFAFAAAAQELPDGAGKADVVKVCDSCHGVSTLIGEARSPSQWNDVVNDMVSRGASGSDDELRRVVDYLSKTFPPVTKINVNTADAKDLETKLEISAKDAEALVRYREQNGKFQSFDDLKKVSGVDLKKIEAKRERLTF
jgi:competence ComEA-like helix-hairpin-helix protein